MTITIVILGVALVILLCVLAEKFSDKFGMPALILFMFIGMLFGSDGVMGIPFENFKGLDKEKFELYLADKYLSLAFSAPNMDYRQKCLYYVTTYIREVKISDVSITNDDGEEVTFRKLVNKYKKLLKEFEALRPIDESRAKFTDYHMKHVLNHVIKYYGSTVNWTIVPNGCGPNITASAIVLLEKVY